jgi:alpha-mannosidase
MRLVALACALCVSIASAVEPDVSARLEPTTVVVTTPEGPRQVVLVEVKSAGLREVAARLTAPGWLKPAEAKSAEVAKGRQTLRVLVPPAMAEIKVSGLLEHQGGKLELSASLKPARHWMMYLVQHTHTDIGYTRPQTEILPEHLRYIDTALDLCDLTESYPDDARFRWTCETSWAVREYLKRRPASQIERLKRRIAEGRIEVAGMLLNMSEIADEISIGASFDALRQIQSVLGNTIQTAMQNDVNGAAWCLPDYFQGLGIRYLTMGINKTRSLLPFDKPTAFWWESPSGKRVLAYRSDHYMTGNSWEIHTGKVDLVEQGIGRYLNRLEGAKYPFDRVAVQFCGYNTDNSPPAMIECDVVRKWNETHVTPKLRMATAKEFLQYVEKTQAASLPVHRQAWPDWWTDGFGSAALETAEVRDTHAAMQINAGLFAIASGLGSALPAGWADRVQAVQEQLLFYDEHTFGASESISDPGVENSVVQWGEKSAYAWDAVKNAAILREEALGLVQQFVPRSELPTIAVFNTLGRRRSGLVQVFIDHELLPKDQPVRIFGALDRKEVPAQRLRSRSEGSYWALWVADVPSLGYKSLKIQVEPEGAAQPAARAAGSSLENQHYRIEIQRETGAIARLVDKQTGRDLVDGSGQWKLGQLIYEKGVDRGDFDKDVFPKEHPFTRTTMANVKVGDVVPGPIWDSVDVTGELEGCQRPGGVTVQIRLYHPEKRVELVYTVRKEPVQTPEAVYVAFPFAPADGKVVYEGQGGNVEPGSGQIPGSSSDWQTVQNFVAVRDGSSQVLLHSSRAPLVQLGGLNLGKWQPVTVVAKPHVFSWVMNNYWFTNFRASQEGEFRWNYVLTSGAPPTGSAAADFGWGSRIPLVGRVLAPGKSSVRLRAEASALAVYEPNLLLVSARPARDGQGLVLQVREVDGKSATMPGTFTEATILETPLSAPQTSIGFYPYETKFLRTSGASPPPRIWTPRK